MDRSAQSTRASNGRLRTSSSPRPRGLRAPVRPQRPMRRGVRRSAPARSSQQSLHRSHGGARTALRSYRHATFLAVAVTTLLLLLAGPRLTDAQQPAQNGAATESVAPVPAEPADPQQSLEEATSTIRQLVNSSVDLAPKVGVALLLIVFAWLLSIVLRAVLHRVLRGWAKTEVVSALVRIALFVLTIGAGLSVIAGDATAFVGSVGLVGLALSWALQTPIESFSGWVLNAFRGYYRRGDRIEVGSVFGDVYRIDVLTTSVWEAGGSGKSVEGAQPTGAIVTFPNWEILRSNIINYSRDFAYVWDEVTFAVANESDLRYTVDVFRETADGVVGRMMGEPAAQYRKLLERERLAFDVEQEPQIYLSLADAWTNVTVRYLVPVRERRRWSSELILALSSELVREEHRERIIGGYPHTRIDMRQRPEELVEHSA